MDGERFLPENPREKAEWTFARFHYDLDSKFGRFRFQRWAADYPKSDRQFTVGVHRLTRLHARSTEHVIDAKSDDIYDWPWLYVEDAGAWHLSEEQAARLREYLLRGGFLMIDDSHGDYEWQTFVAGMRMIFPDRPIEDLKNQDEIFHVFYDLDDRVQIPGTRYIWGRRQYTPDSAIPHGVPFATIKAASSSPSATIPMSATPGNGPTAPNIPNALHRSRIASASTTSSME